MPWQHSRRARLTHRGRRSTVEAAADVIAQAEAIMGCRLPEASATVVRDVSPHKLMMCLSFVVPDDIAWAPVASADGEGTEAKRQRLEE